MTLVGIIQRHGSRSGDSTQSAGYLSRTIAIVGSSSRHCRDNGQRPTGAKVTNLCCPPRYLASTSIVSASAPHVFRVGVVVQIRGPTPASGSHWKSLHGCKNNFSYVANTSRIVRKVNCIMHPIDFTHGPTARPWNPTRFTG